MIDHDNLNWKILGFESNAESLPNRALSLSKNGKTFFALERHEDSHEKHLNKWIFDKEAP